MNIGNEFYETSPLLTSPCPRRGRCAPRATRLAAGEVQRLATSAFARITSVRAPHLSLTLSLDKERGLECACS